MLAELVDKLVALGRATDLVHVYEDKDLQLKFVQHRDQVQQLVIPPAPRAHTLRGLEDVLAVLKDPTMARAPAVFHDNNAVHVYLDRNDRRECVTMPLLFTTRFAALVNMKRIEADPRTIVRTLRQSYGDAVPPGVLAILGRLDFSRTNAGSTRIEHGKESLGKAVEAAVQQAEAVPEFFYLVLPVYSNPWLRGIQASVRMDIYLNVLEQTLSLWVQPDELETAVQQAQARVHEAITTACPDVPVYYGSP